MAITGKLTVMESGVALMMCILLLTAQHGESAVSCMTVINAVYPCYDYVMNGGGKVPEACCKGIKYLSRAAKTRTDRQTVCSCLKSMASSVDNMNFDNIASLPSKCGVDIPYKISPNMDCSMVTKV